MCIRYNVYTHACARSPRKNNIRYLHARFVYRLCIPIHAYGIYCCSSYLPAPRYDRRERVLSADVEKKRSPTRLKRRHFVSSCTGLFVGPYCQWKNPCHTGPVPRCQNGGTCAVTQLTPHSQPGFSCKCPLGFTASLCEIPISNACDSKPCQNGGTCWLHDIKEHRCNCAAGFTGKNRAVSCLQGAWVSRRRSFDETLPARIRPRYARRGVYRIDTKSALDRSRMVRLVERKTNNAADQNKCRRAAKRKGIPRVHARLFSPITRTTAAAVGRMSCAIFYYYAAPATS